MGWTSCLLFEKACLLMPSEMGQLLVFQENTIFDVQWGGPAVGCSRNMIFDAQRGGPAVWFFKKTQLLKPSGVDYLLVLRENTTFEAQWNVPVAGSSSKANFGRPEGWTSCLFFEKKRRLTASWVNQRLVPQ